MATVASRRRPGARRGSLIVTSFVVVICMVMVMGGIHTMLKEQIRQSGEIRTVSLAKLQALYLAEMGVNHVMFEASRTGAMPGLPLTVNLKPKVAMVRAPNPGAASVTVSATVPGDPDAPPAPVPPYKVEAQLVTPDGTFRRTAYFNAALNGDMNQWVLTAYKLGR